MSEGLVHIRAELSKSGSKCAPKVVAQGPVAARAKLQAVPLGVCKVEDHPWGCHSVCHLACAWELRALPQKRSTIRSPEPCPTLTGIQFPSQKILEFSRILLNLRRLRLFAAMSACTSVSCWIWRRISERQTHGGDLRPCHRCLAPLRTRGRSDDGPLSRARA